MPKIHIEFEVPGTPKRVFQALTDPTEIEVWSGQPAVLEPKVGGTMELFEWATGKVTKIEADKTLAYTWVVPEWGDKAKESVVTYTLDPTSSGTAITVDHTNLPNAKEAKSHQDGWYSYVLNPLKEYLADAAH